MMETGRTYVDNRRGVEGCTEIYWSIKGRGEEFNLGSILVESW
jgi:hypothetical protein